MTDEIGSLAPSGVPYKIVKATKDKPTFASGAKGQYDALILTFEITRGDRQGVTFGKNYTFFRNDDGTQAGPGARYLKAAAKLMHVDAITKASQLIGWSFVHEVVEKENKQGGNPFLEFYPIAVWGKPPQTNADNNENKLTTTPGNGPIVRTNRRLPPA